MAMLAREGRIDTEAKQANGVRAMKSSSSGVIQPSCKQPREGTPVGGRNTSSARVLVITASASSTSRSERLGKLIVHRLRGQHVVDTIDLRNLPATAMLHADCNDPRIAEAVRLVDDANAIVFVTPTYKGSFTGLLKVFIDLLPQHALRGKVILPIATGGSVAHVLMIDYGLRPVLQTMWPRCTVQGCFVLDRDIEIDEDGRVELAPDAHSLLFEVMDQFETAVSDLLKFDRPRAAEPRTGNGGGGG